MDIHASLLMCTASTLREGQKHICLQSPGMVVGSNSYITSLCVSMLMCIRIIIYKCKRSICKVHNIIVKYYGALLGLKALQEVLPRWPPKGLILCHFFRMFMSIFGSSLAIFDFIVLIYKSRNIILLRSLICKLKAILSYIKTKI